MGSSGRSLFKCSRAIVRCVSPRSMGSRRVVLPSVYDCWVYPVREGQPLRFVQQARGALSVQGSTDWPPVPAAQCTYLLIGLRQYPHSRRSQSNGPPPQTLCPSGELGAPPADDDYGVMTPRIAEVWPSWPYLGDLNWGSERTGRNREFASVYCFATQRRRLTGDSDYLFQGFPKQKRPPRGSLVSWRATPTCHNHRVIWPPEQGGQLMPPPRYAHHRSR